MPTIVEQFGPATVVLFNAPFESTLPPMSELKRVLGVDQVRYYSSNGRFSQEIGHLLLALDVDRELAPPKNSLRLVETSCTHAFITGSQVAWNAAVGLHYDAKVIAGFQLQGECMSELGDLLAKYQKVQHVRSCAACWLSDAKRNIETIEETGYCDAVVTGLDVGMFEDLSNTYGATALNTARSLICEWVNRHTWVHP